MPERLRQLVTLVLAASTVALWPGFVLWVFLLTGLSLVLWILLDGLAASVFKRLGG